MGDDGALGKEGDAVYSGTAVRRGGSGRESHFVRRVGTRRFKKRDMRGARIEWLATGRESFACELG